MGNVIKWKNNNLIEQLDRGSKLDKNMDYGHSKYISIWIEFYNSIHYMTIQDTPTKFQKYMWIFKGASSAILFHKIYIGFSKFIKKKYFRMNLVFSSSLKYNFWANLDQGAVFLRSRRFNSYIYQNILSTMASMATMAIFL